MQRNDRRDFIPYYSGNSSLLTSTWTGKRSDSLLLLFFLFLFFCYLLVARRHFSMLTDEMTESSLDAHEEYVVELEGRRRDLEPLLQLIHE